MIPKKKAPNGARGEGRIDGSEQDQADKSERCGVHRGASDETKRADAKALVKLMHTESGEKPQMWGPSIIGFGSYHYIYESGREGDMPLIAFSPRKAAIVLYIGLGLSGSKALLAKLGKHTMGKGCLYIKKLVDVDETVLKEIVAKSVAAAREK